MTAHRGEVSVSGVGEKKRSLAKEEGSMVEGKKQKVSTTLKAGLQDQPCEDQ